MTDKNGKWIIKNGIKLLVEPSNEWIDAQSEIKKSETYIRHNILKELQTLDMEIPRIVEDIIEQGNFIIHQSKIDKINRKKELRLELQSIT